MGDASAQIIWTDRQAKLVECFVNLAPDLCHRQEPPRALVVREHRYDVPMQKEERGALTRPRVDLPREPPDRLDDGSREVCRDRGLDVSIIAGVRK